MEFLISGAAAKRKQLKGMATDASKDVLIISKLSENYLRVICD